MARSIKPDPIDANRCLHLGPVSEARFDVDVRSKQLRPISSGISGGLSSGIWALAISILSLNRCKGFKARFDVSTRDALFAISKSEAYLKKIDESQFRQQMKAGERGIDLFLDQLQWLLDIYYEHLERQFALRVVTKLPPNSGTSAKPAREGPYQGFTIYGDGCDKVTEGVVDNVEIVWVYNDEHVALSNSASSGRGLNHYHRFA